MQDDFGDQVIRGYYSGRMVWPDDVKKFGGTIPNVSSNFQVMDHQEYGTEAFKRARFNFECSEGNCHKTRPKGFKRALDGLIPIICETAFSVNHPLMYSKNFESKTFLVHPECFKHIQGK